MKSTEICLIEYFLLFFKILFRNFVEYLQYCAYNFSVLPYLMLPPAGGLENFIYMQLTDTDTPSKTGEGEDEEEKAARLVSLPITAPDADLCMSFWYHMTGEHTGALHIKQRKQAEGGQILWTVSGHQGNRWREGRVLLPHSSVSYQVRVQDMSELCTKT